MKPVAPDRPQFTIFGGPNGAGKSTTYDRFSRAGFHPGEYLNPDEIAKSAGESGVSGSTVDMRAAREVLKRTRSLVEAHRSFVRESTLTGRKIVRAAEVAKAAGYRLVLVFVAVSSPATPRGRIAVRVAKGGHHIPVEAQERRFPRAFDNVRKVLPLVDVAYFLDNAGFWHRLVGTACRGTLTFLDAQEASWVERATADLPRARLLKSREEALKDLRSAERMTEDLEIREPQGGDVVVS